MNTKKLYYTISETAVMLEENISTIRYWSNTFEKFLSPRRNGKGNRLYLEKEIEVLRRIKYYTRDCGLSLEATSRKLSSKDSEDEKMVRLRESLLQIRARLVQIRETL